ncbi:MAG: DNA-binding transcriptional regulator [Synergistaceae bacterium]|nr:DNA-binding transcriptional regulator [Synergistaceae bacterium]
MTESQQNDLTLNLCRAFAVLNDPESVRAFLDDIASPGEIRAMSQRLEVARLLSESKTYPEIMRLTGAGTATISRVKRCIDYGPGGYKRVLRGE